jgi:hypothetical protein
MGMKGRELTEKTKDRRHQMQTLDARYRSLIATS